MDTNRTAPPSARWDGPAYDERGGHWTARLRHTLPDRERATGLETVVYGPTEWACVAEANRQDRLWVEYPLRTDDRDGARARLRFLAGGAG
ncbi:hypothetical protein [Actinomadura sp. WMMB 499]|uniref:hypothetical protein n=1 Tax=Actinomadura sp. WMMB 499 TaxID=1219491 RepID=UPI001248D524|nr:hypothetical protein [Actinomadura sp. WMMB 499]QFG22397.1 hypothetical protein F7P10_15940 [Actinomadura sp. WMMB 499]